MPRYTLDENKRVIVATDRDAYNTGQMHWGTMQEDRIDNFAPYPIDHSRNRHVIKTHFHGCEIELDDVVYFFYTKVQTDIYGFGEKLYYAKTFGEALRNHQLAIREIRAKEKELRHDAGREDISRGDDTFRQEPDGDCTEFVNPIPRPQFTRTPTGTDATFRAWVTNNNSSGDTADGPTVSLEWTYGEDCESSGSD